MSSARQAAREGSRGYRFLIALLFGAAGFAANFLDLELFHSPQFKVSILIGLLFPLLVALAWGWRMALLAALAGGCQTMWILWSGDGWGVLYAVPVFTLWVVWHGYWADRRRVWPRRWYYSSFAVEIPFRLCSTLGFYLLFPLLVSMNPPPWNPAIAWNEVPVQWVHTVVAKHVVTAYLLLLMAHVLLALKPLRRIFRLERRVGEKEIGVLYSAAILIGVLLWGLDALVDHLFFAVPGQTFWEVAVLQVSHRELFMRNLYFIVPLIAAAVLDGNIRHRLFLEARVHHLNRVLAAIRNVNQLSTKEHDVSRLIRRSVRLLTENGGYLRAVLVLGGHDGGVQAVAGSDVSDETGSSVDEGMGAWLLSCLEGAPAASRDGVVPLERMSCRDSAHDGDGLHCCDIAAPLEHRDRRFGVLGLSLPPQLKNDSEEHNLVAELAGDLAFALYSREQERQRQAAETELASYRERLEQLVEERTAALETTNGELEAFVYAVSHDLRAPLRSIGGFGSFLEREYGSRLDQRGEHFLRRIREGVERMEHLISSLLMLSRLSRSEMERQQVDLSSLIEGVAETLRSAEPEREVGIAVQPGMTAFGDHGLLRVLYENLLGNAWKFTRGVRAPHVECGVERQEGRSVYYVRDNGAGFDGEQAHKLFQPFQRLHSPRQFPGDGIGLATVQRIVTRHGGRVWAEGEAGEGAAFFFYLGEPSPSE